jgi:hypothetical protein
VCGRTSSVPPSPPTVEGEWVSTATVNGRPEVTLRLQTGQAPSMTLKGEHRGDIEWVELKLNEVRSDGAVAAFQTDLPYDEGRVRWTLTAVSNNIATLIALPEDADSADEPARWQLHK